MVKELKVELGYGLGLGSAGMGFGARMFYNIFSCIIGIVLFPNSANTGIAYFMEWNIRMGSWNHVGIKTL